MSEIYYDRNRIIQKPTTYRSNQFQDFNTYEPGTLSPTAFDNPPFLWPKKQYMDITGNTHTVQRGYMRSLITDPAYNPGSAVPNRRLFFQFNPQVLVRSVQQSVGAMNPLLQDPAQLVQPVPGTTTFGFELLFNREHEVAAGANTGDAEGAIRLPNGTEGLVSQIGVLADILVLDTITGQGISQDMINLLVEQATQQAEKYLASAGAYLTDSEEDRMTQKKIDATKSTIQELSDSYNANIGNQAFLNPLPFRVLFSSLFMVEGVATSVDVQFQKFSRTMIPTQCKVTINMYALYFGFARKDTFLTKNLAEGAKVRRDEAISAENTSRILDTALSTIVADPVLFNKDAAVANGLGFRVNLQANQRSNFLTLIKNGTVKDVRVRVNVNYKFQPLSTSKATSSSDLTSSAQLYYNPTIAVAPDRIFDIPIETLNISASGRQTLSGSTNLASEELASAMRQEAGKPSPNEYISYQLTAQLVAKVGSNDVTSSTFVFSPIVDGIHWYNNGDGVAQKWTNPIVENDTTTRGGSRR